MDKRRAYEILLDLLTRVVAARGGDASRLAEEIPWREDTPRSAVSLGSMLTGGNPAQPASVSSPPGVTSVRS